MPRAGVRVSLTGETIGDASGLNAQPGPDYGNNTSGMPSRPRAMPTGARPPDSPYARREAAPDNSGRNALLINLSVALVFILLCLGGGYWRWTHRTNPKAQVARYIHAIQWLDWGVVYDLSATPPGNKSRSAFISMMNDKFDNNPVLKIVGRHSMEKIQFEVGEPTISNDEATVPVSRSATELENGNSMKLTLTNVGGIWKIHPLADNPMDILHSSEEDKAGGGAALSLPSGAGGINP